jgi:putative adhesin
MRLANHGTYAAVALACLCLGAGTAAGHGRWGAGAGMRTAGSFHWSWAIPAGKAIEIKGVSGGIRATATGGREVVVDAVKRARRSDPDQVEIVVLEHEDGITLCVKYPAPPGKENECAPGEGGHMHTDKNDVEVSFDVRVPAGVRLIARTVNGEIEADDLEGPVEAMTVNGSVRVTTSSYAWAHTVNGSVVASLGSTAAPEPLSFYTVNGGIRITLPSGLDADVRAETVNGVIESDFPVTVTGRVSRRRLHGTIGRGGQRIELETVNGNVGLYEGRRGSTGS